VAAVVPAPARVETAPVVVEVRGVDKTFNVPANRVDSLKERLTGRGRNRDFRELRALRDISFDVHHGEFFGIVGRNGSGKSTLLKILASIYRADAGRVRMAGRLAPFIELGVGFNPELTARSNVTLNGVLMGLSRHEAQRRLDAVLDFAELRDFVDLQLKNYSSGMMVRLAFAVMVEADADIMLIDEVLAVGDASFQQKCMDVFHAKRDAGKTIVLVTHDMATVQAMCDRAMLIHDGELMYCGEAEEAALRYYRLNFSEDSELTRDSIVVPDVNAKLLEARLTDEDGREVGNVEQGRPLYVDVSVEARHDLDEPVFGFHFVNADEVTVFGVNHLVATPDGSRRVNAGTRMRVRGRIDNPLLPGRYFVHLWIHRSRSHGNLALHVVRLFDFMVYGTRPGPGSVEVASELESAVYRRETG